MSQDYTDSPPKLADSNKSASADALLEANDNETISFAVLANGKHVTICNASSVSLNAFEDEKVDEGTTWHQSEHARSSIVSLLSCLYALVLVILALAFEVSVVQEKRSTIRYEMFYIYLYVVALAFFAYMYCFLLRSRNSRGNQAIARFKVSMDIARESFRQKLHSQNGGFAADGSAATIGRLPSRKRAPLAVAERPEVEWDPETRTLRRPSLLPRLATHSAPSAGSMYLKLGGVVFGIVGVISNGLTLLSRLESDCLSATEAIVLILSSTFVFVQLYFIFMNSKLTIHSFQNMGRAGMMHVVATNLCIWIKSIVLEEYHVMEEIGERLEEINQQTKSGDKSSQLHEIHDSSRRTHPKHAVSTTILPSISQTLKHSFASMTAGTASAIAWVSDFLDISDIADPSPDAAGSGCALNRMEVYLEDAKPFMITCMIEYSILCAAIMYVLWRNIGWDAPQRTKHRKQSIRVDCSSSTGGLFVGLIFVVFTIVSMIVFFVKVHVRENETAMWVFYGSFSVLYSVATIGCIVGMYQMRNLKYVPPRRMAGIILLDDILLCVSLFGQLSYCFFSMIAVTANDLIEYMSVMTNCIRVFQVLLQTIFILSGQRLVSKSQTKKPGREVIVFLLVLNIALWLINTFETQKASVNPLMVDFYGKGPWTIIVHSTIPLCIFYRFHSSVCLAEIWKSVYRTKNELY